MTSFDEFKAALGPAAAKYSDAEIDEMRLLCERMADVVFDNWLGKVNSEIQ